MRWLETFSACLAALVTLNLTRAVFLPILLRRRLKNFDSNPRVVLKDA